MMQDSKGRLFFLSTSGLSIYDGARFTNYTTAEGLAQDVVNDVLEITPDSFLVAVNTNTLNCLVRNEIHAIKTADGYCPVINVFSRVNGKIFAGADEGLFVWERDRFMHLPIVYQGREVGNYIIDIKAVGKFLLLLINPGLGPDAGTLYIYDPATQEAVYKKSDYPTSQLVFTPTGDVWISTLAGIELLRKADLEQGVYNPLPLPEEYASLSKEKPLSMKFDKLGRLWVSLLNKGVTLYDQRNSNIQYSEASGLSTNRISFIFEDKEQNHWFITEGIGAQKLVGSNIELLEHPFGMTAISDIYIHRGSDSLWLTEQEGNRLILVTGNTSRIFQLPHQVPFRGITTTNNSTMFELDQDNIDQLAFPQKGNNMQLICTYQHGLRKASYGTLDANGNLIICTENAIRVFFKDCTTFSYPFVDFADQVCLDKKGLLWIITRSNRLISFSIHSEDKEHYLKMEQEFSSQLPLLNPRTLMIDSINRIWIGTRFAGLYCLRVDGKKLTQVYHLSRKNGLTGDFINYLTCDSNTIWATSPAGLDQLTLRNDELIIDNITQANKMYVSLVKVLWDKNGVVWALGDAGNIVKINPTAKPVIDPPKFFLSFIRAGQQLYSPFETNLSFPYQQNNLSFFVAAPTFFDEKQIKYSYQLLGSASSQWSEPVTEPALHFVNLSPGKYTLKVKAIFPAGRYPAQFLEYRFAIQPPWWGTWWFTTLMILVGVAIFILIVRSYYRAKFAKQKIALEKKQAVEKERTRIATDMHDDLGAGLSRIKYLSESIQFNKSITESISNDVQKIASYSDEMVEKMGEIVWALNEKNDSIEHLVAFTRAYAVDYLTTNKIQCVFNAAEELPATFLTGELRRNLFLSVKESLHNVVKHAGARTVTIRVTIGSHICVSIHDDGVGIDLNHVRPFSNGLSNIRKRMEEVGGKAVIQNSDGTNIQLEVPLPK
jgi:signal transduction histidine kinase/ligand-binding sensor domain-containing protein